MRFLETLFTLSGVICVFLCVVCKCDRYEEKYITLPVDHFSFSSNKTFELRYLINDTFTNGNRNSPILFYCGNEANIELFARTTGFIWELAPKINALIVFAEHRYYGKSLPYGKDDNQQFGYLTIEQTLADFVALLYKLNIGVETIRPTVAVGGSYGGILAALFRIRYPHMVAAALAASAPLKQFSNLTPCDEYSKTLTAAFQKAYNGHCTSNIKKSWTVLKNIAFENGGVKFFNDLFNFCEPWVDSSSVDGFIDQLYNVYWDMSMTNYPYEADVYTPLPANPVKKFCSQLDVEHDGRNLIRALHQALQVYVNPYRDRKCFMFPHRKVMQPYEHEAWNFQRCSEILTGMCDRAESSMFPSGGEDFYQAIDSCNSTFGNQVTKAINKINQDFGVATLITASNIIFSNGLLDPWSAASVLQAPNDKTLVINIPEGAHHIDLRQSNAMDPPSVTRARELEELYLKKWIREFRRKINYFM